MVEIANKYVILADVAKAANVSISTASRALRNDPQIAESTRQRVHMEAQRLNYRNVGIMTDSKGHDALRFGQARSALRHLLIVLHETRLRSFFAEALVEMAQLAQAQETQTRIYYGGEGSPLHDTVEAALQTKPEPDAIVLFTWLNLTEEDAQKLQKLGKPVVLINRHVEGFTNAVTLDDYSAGVRMARHLYALGHRRIAHFMGQQSVTALRERAVGFRAELEALGCYDPDLFVLIDRNNLVAAIQQAVRQVRDIPDPATAIWTVNDAAAAVALTTLTAAGVHAPEHISIAGFDHMHSTRQFGITTFDYSFSELGRSAVVLAEAILAGRLRQPTRVCVIPTFIKGRTTGPCNFSPEL